MGKRNPKWQRQTKKLLEGAGCELRSTSSGGHTKVWKDGRQITTIPGSPSDRRAIKNLQTVLRKAGIDVKLPNP